MKINKTFKELAGNTIIFAIAEFSAKLVSFILMPLITLNLSPEVFGKAEYIVNLSELLYPLFTVGLTDALLRFTIKDKTNLKNHPVDILASCTLIGVLGSIIMIIGFLCLDRFHLTKDHALCCFLFISVFVSTFLGQYLRGLDLNIYFALSGIIRSLSLFVTFFLFVIYKQGEYTGYVTSIIVSNLISTFYMIVILLIKKIPFIGSFEKQLTKKMLKYSLPLIPNMLCWWGIQLSNKYFLTFFYDIGMFGIYTSISKIATLINIVSIVFGKAWTVSAVKISDKKEYEFNSVLFRLYSSLIILGASFLILCLPLISKVLLRGEYFQYWSLTSISLLIAVFNCYSAFFGPFYSVNYNNLLNLLSTFIGFIIILSTSFIFIPRLGLLGALISSLMGYAVLAIFRYYTTKSISNIVPNTILEISSLTILIIQGFASLFNSDKLQMYFFINTLSLIILFSMNYFSMKQSFKKMLVSEVM